MKTSTIEELKALHNSIGNLIVKLDNDEIHNNLMSLIGMCYVSHRDKTIVATKIIKVEITQNDKSTRVVMYVDRVEAQFINQTLDVVVVEHTPMPYTLQQALRIARFEGFDAMKPAQFEHLKTVAKSRQESVWEDLCEAAA
jgi:alpha-mannosidase